MGELEDRIERLQVKVRTCLKHNNPAKIEMDMQGEFIIAPECGCWISMNSFDSLEEAVAWWNDRPYVDSLMEEYVTEVELGRHWQRQFEELLEAAGKMNKLVFSIAEQNRVTNTLLLKSYKVAKKLQQGIDEYNRKRSTPRERKEAK